MTKIAETNKTENVMNLVISKVDILSALSYCSIRQSPYDFPKNLEKALVAASKKLDEFFGEHEKSSISSYKMVSIKEIRELLKDLVFNIPEISIWNVTQIESDKGITGPNDPKRTVKYSFVGRGIHTNADEDFIDLDALRRNMENMIVYDR
jgi:hypothetical protein